ncbi:MAG: 3'-5' exonuclease, partial [Betaproteobacteria bacterium]
MTPVLAFDIETIPDCAGIRGLYDLPADLPDADVAELAFQKRRVSSGSDFLPPHLQRIIVIGCVLREGDGVQVFSIAEPERDEPAILQKFFDGIDKYTPQLVSWNGTGFDLPVLNCRTL